MVWCCMAVQQQTVLQPFLLDNPGEPAPEQLAALGRVQQLTGQIDRTIGTA